MSPGQWGGPGWTYNPDTAATSPGTAAGSPQPRPLDWQEQLATSQANRNVALSDANATYQTGQINRDFGYLGNGQIDPNNPYSRAALLEQTYKNSLRGNTNSYASQGQLYAGSLQNAQNETHRQHSIGVNSLQNAYQDALHGVTLGQLNSYANAGSSVSDAQFQALLQALGAK